MKFMPLKEVCSKIIDCPHESPQWLREGIPVIRNFNLIDGQLNTNELYYVDEKTYKKRTRRATPIAGDIIFSREAPIGNCAIVPDNFQCCLGQRLVLLRVNYNVCTPEYLLAALLSNYVKKQVDQVSKTGSIVSNFAIGDLEKLMIPIAENQTEVSSFFSAVNEKIIKNKDNISIISKILNLIYDYWFIQFDFPDPNGNPYKSSGGAMEWNAELKREIPSGWKVTKLSELACKGKEYSYTNHECVPTFDLSVMPSSNMLLSDFNESTNFSTNLFELKKGDILFGSIRPYLRKAGIAPCDGAVAGTVHVVRPKRKEDYNFLAMTLCNERMFKYAIAACQGTKMPVVSIDSILDYKVAYDENIVEKFNLFDIRNVFSNTAVEIHELSSLRDFLLPMLMNGQVKVTA